MKGSNNRLQIFKKLSDLKSSVYSRTLAIPFDAKLEDQIRNIAMQIGDLAKFEKKQDKFEITYYDSRHSQRAMQDLACFDPQLVHNQEFNDDLVTIEGKCKIQEIKNMLKQYGSIDNIKKKNGITYVHFCDIRAATNARNEQYLVQRCLAEKVITIDEREEKQEDVCLGKENEYNGHYDAKTYDVQEFGYPMQPLYEINYAMYDPVIAMLPPRQTSICKNNLDDQFQVDVYSVMHGFDSRQTLMIKNIPNKYNQIQLLEEISRRMKENWKTEVYFDFFYLPIDFSNSCNVGYAFINFMNAESIINFYMEFVGKRWELYSSKKVCQLSYARIQGKDALIQHYMKSNVMKVRDERLKPIIFGDYAY